MAQTLTCRLWEDDFHIISCCEADTEGDQMARAAWIHDILLDCLGHMSTTTRAYDAFVLDHKFGSLLEDGQMEVKKALMPLTQLYESQTVRETSSWGSISTILEQFGQSFDLDEEGYRRPHLDEELHFSESTQKAAKDEKLFQRQKRGSIAR